MPYSREVQRLQDLIKGLATIVWFSDNPPGRFANTFK